MRHSWLSAMVVLLFMAATYLFAEPTDVSMRVGVPVMVVGALCRYAAAVADDGRCPSERGGIFRHVRNPRELATLLLATGIVLFAASEERRGRWVPRTVAPLGLLYFFFFALPAADAQVRDWVRRDGGDGGAAYLTEVPSLVPRWSPWRGSDARRVTIRWTAIGGTLGVAAQVLLLAVLCAHRQGLVETFGF